MDLQERITITYTATLNTDLIDDHMSNGVTTMAHIQSDIQKHGIDSQYVMDAEVYAASPVFVEAFAGKEG